tara:strand:- start:4642 stop:5301 length:660 start_codon:yes stop_codon:yes gene_type:complete
MITPRHFIINKLFKKYNFDNPNYLEIGVWEGETFSKVLSNNKDGVDPEQYCSSDYVNYKMTSDEFFSKHNNKKYDFIFIDGLHTAFQVTKDLYNSINCINDNGIIMLDDVYPHNEYEQEALNLNKSGAQTGDVWKSIYNYFDILKEISEEILFFKNSERGNLVFKIKKNNIKNIVIDNTIPTKNIDGWYQGNDKEWLKYDYKNHFNDYYLNCLNKYRVD